MGRAQVGRPRRRRKEGAENEDLSEVRDAAQQQRAGGVYGVFRMGVSVREEQDAGDEDMREGDVQEAEDVGVEEEGEREERGGGEAAAGSGARGADPKGKAMSPYSQLVEAMRDELRKLGRTENWQITTHERDYGSAIEVLLNPMVGTKATRTIGPMHWVVVLRAEEHMGALMHADVLKAEDPEGMVRGWVRWMCGELDERLAEVAKSPEKRGELGL